VPDEPVIFFKPPSSLLPHGETVRCPARSRRLDYEVELAVAIGKRARDVVAADWADVVLGYTVLNDMTARDMQLVAIENNQPWDHSKGFDTFAPCGPYLVTPDEVPDPNSLDLSLSIGDRVLQQSNTRHMIFSVPQLIEVISTGITLEPGDIIATGTPSGIGPVEHGETMVATVETVGTLVNSAAYEAVSADTQVASAV
jgi:5-oxopent-3-ene-1,2,5-tricarboxylate decarboxylase/2-hydroxyhepta-2,4-diene-1,7-dioate isomerase